MKKPPFVLLFAVCVWLAGAGCAHLDTTPGGDVNRVIAGTVNFRGDLVLPPDAEVVVRLIDAAGTGQLQGAADNTLPVANRARVAPVAQVLGEQTIKAPPAGPVAFRIEYAADDALLRHGLNLEARISYEGKVRFRTVDAYLVTLSSLDRNHELWVAVAGR